MEKFANNTTQFKIDRYPVTQLSSLKPWNAADAYLLSYTEEQNLQAPVAIVNDRFGFLALGLRHLKPTLFIDYKSQEKAINKNLATNHIEPGNYEFLHILSNTHTAYNLCLVKVPKSMELFALYLQKLAQFMNPDGTVLCGFMTKYFTKSMLEIAGRYFGKVEQSLAWKKSRLLILSEPLKQTQEAITEKVLLPNGINLMQYKGVFSSGKIDVGTRFLLEHLKLSAHENTVLDLACGNGIIAHHISTENSDAKLYLVDDFYLAIESAKLNLPHASCYFNNELTDFNNEYFDVIVTNPPFHFGHETNIEVSLNLFRQSSRCLKNSGRLIIVANRHLNYGTHLRNFFGSVIITNENKKFQIIECRNPQ